MSLALNKLPFVVANRIPVIFIGSVLAVGCSSSNSEIMDADTIFESDDVQVATRIRSKSFVRLSVDSSDPNGNSVLGNCGGNFVDATATLELLEQPGKAEVTISITNAKPDTLFTTWLRLRGTTDDGVSFGGNPLTGRGSTPLAPSSALPDLLAATGAGNSAEETANGIRTDDDGSAVLVINTDFPVDGGAYPFHKFADFDQNDDRYSAEAPSAHPVAIVNSATGDVDAPFMIRIVSHCTDNLAHGLEPAAREPWFDLSGL